MKVWVPIDLPDGFRVREVVAEIGGMLGAVQTIKLVPCDDPTVDLPREHEPPAPQRERWEYDSMAIDALDPDRANEEFGAEGWELMPLVIDGIIWFKRRVIP